MVRETPLRGLQEPMSGSVSQASELGDGLPEQALEKLQTAQVSVQKLQKALTSLITNMKGHRGKNDLIDSAFTNLADELATLRAADNTLDGIQVLGLMPDNTTATCKKFIIVSNLADAKSPVWCVCVWPLPLAYTPYVRKRQRHYT